MKILFSYITLILITYIQATSQNTGKVTVKFDRGIESSINAYIVNASEEKTKGFRVQLCSESGNNAKSIANSIKSSFLRNYDGVPAYLKWESPNFKVRVGDFKTRLDATLFWKQIVMDFPASYVVMDEIEMLKFEK